MKCLQLLVWDLFSSQRLVCPFPIETPMLLAHQEMVVPLWSCFPCLDLEAPSPGEAGLQSDTFAS